MFRNRITFYVTQYEAECRLYGMAGRDEHKQRVGNKVGLQESKTVREA